MTSALEDMKPLDITDWLTLNTASSPTKLPIGQTPNANNTWVDEKPGSVITAPGYRKVGAIPSGNPVTFCINYFKASSGTQTFVVSDNATVWTTVDFQNFTVIIGTGSSFTALSSAFQLRGMVIRDKLWLTNGSDSVHTFDGTTVVSLDGTGSTPTVPKGRYINYHDERVWLYHIPSNRSQVAFSVLTDSGGTIIAPDNANAWPSSNTLQISEGDADYGTGLLVYRGYLYLFKQYSIWRLIGYDEYTYTRVKCRASTGTRFNESLQVVDSLVHMIGVDGIYVFDGEEADRISDIIDPATASQSAFGFNQLQQPNSNNQFWEVAATADWNAGTKMTNVSVDDELAIAAADDSQADFQAGALFTNVDTAISPGNLSLAYVGSGGTGPLVSVGNPFVFSGTANAYFGQFNYLTDGNRSNYFGITAGDDLNIGRWQVDLGSVMAVGKVILRDWQFWRFDATLSAFISRIEVSSDGTNWISVGDLTLPTPTFLNGVFNGAFGTKGWITTIQDLTLSFTTVAARYVRWYVQSNKPTFRMTEFEVYKAGYQSSGKFISKPLDYGSAPASYGNFSADTTTYGEAITYFTQSSSDGTSWDSEVAVANGAAIGSTLKRYLRWGAYLYSSTGVNSPLIDDVFVGTMYLSAIHNTGGSIFAWGPFEADYFLAGQQIKYYYRASTTAGGVPGASWNLIAPGGVPSVSVTLTYIQFKVEILGGAKANIAYVGSVTINWVKGTGVQPQTLQNVASFFWRNRYWMSAASSSSAYNDIILVRGKKTFKSPWQLKDWPILSFCRYQDGFYGGSSVDGSIYQLDVGYSKDSAALDSFFETGDFTFMGNHIHCHEVELEVERTGSYNLKFGISIDRGATWTEYDVPVTASTFIPSYWVKLYIDPGTTPYIRFRVRTNGIDQPFEVHNLRAYYEIRTARGSLR
jgi:hypothetical protein